MEKGRSIKKRILIISCSVFLAVVLMAAGLIAYAYFSTRAYLISSDGTREYARLGMELNTFFDRLTVDSGTSIKIPNTKTAAEDDYYTFDSDADWGSAQNPYIISELRHLRNLSVLQNIGFFKSDFTDKFSAEDASTDPEDCMPYFLVCNPDGTPVLIDGTDMAEAYEPIGNDDNPFIGYVGGAFTGGTGTEVSVDGKTSDQSVIYNVKIQPASDFVDVGLFGCIGYLGNESTLIGDTQTFRGAASTVTDLLLYNVQISVDDGDEDAGWWTRIFTSVTDNIAHRFGWKGSPAAPQEDHHIGILAGHVEYATVSYISVFYSADDIPAIDVSHVKADSNGKKANYMSNSGIIGYVYQMNSTFRQGTIGKDGTTNADLQISSGGMGTGGGGLSGIGRGYVTAGDIFNNYHDAVPKDSELTLMNGKSDADNSNLCTQYYRDTLWNIFGSVATDRYYFYDGVFTFALSSTSDVVKSTWNNDGDAADKYFIGSNNASKWRGNYSKGNNSVVAYVKQIMSTSDLDAAITAGKDIFIGYVTNNGNNISLMSLYKTDTNANFLGSDDMFTTEALNKPFKNDTADIIQTLEDSGADRTYFSGSDTLLTETQMTTLTSQIGNGTVKIINLGSTTDLETLTNEFRITAVKNDPGEYVFTGTTSGYSLSLLECRGLLTGYSCSIWSGKSSAKPSGFGKTFTVFDLAYVTITSGNATLRFTNSRTGNNNRTRYVQYDTNNNNFRGSSSSQTVYLYTLEARSNLNFGEITFEPVADDTNRAELSADQYLLWPETTYTGTAIQNANRRTADPTYTIKHFASTSGNDILDTNYWKNGSGLPLSNADLKKEFVWGTGTANINIISIGGGNVGTDAQYVKAPIGSEGREAIIPTGCVAFRVNNSNSENKIRVIVAVPTSPFYREEEVDDEEVTLDYNEDYYFCMWKTEEAGNSLLQTINVGNCTEAFELPRSNTYAPGSAPDSADSNYIIVRYKIDGTFHERRCYLNGNKVLVAYEFEANEEGVYVLGANHACEIVYFSADATASAGNDGESSYKMGTIDYVYSNSDNSKVLTVRDIDTRDRTAQGYARDYTSYYYQSYVLLYTQNNDIVATGDTDSYSVTAEINGTPQTVTYPSIEDMKIYARRIYLTGDDEPQMSWVAEKTDKPYIKLERYSIYADYVNERQATP